MAEALQVIHAAGVVHRDLKPSNVLLAPDGPRVIDFGIARAAEAASVTGSGIRVGSPQFMAPEQIRGTTATPAVDVFALGSLAAFTLLGRVPFGEGNPAALMHRVLNAEPNLTGCSGPIRDLIAGCLTKDPAGRPDPAQIIETCRTLAQGNLGDFAESWWPTLSTPAQLGTVGEPQLGAPSPSPAASPAPGRADGRSSPPPAAPAASGPAVDQPRRDRPPGVGPPPARQEQGQTSRLPPWSHHPRQARHSRRSRRPRPLRGPRYPRRLRGPRYPRRLRGPRYPRRPRYPKQPRCLPHPRFLRRPWLLRHPR